VPTPQSASSLSQPTASGQVAHSFQGQGPGSEPDLPLEVQPPPGNTLYERLRHPFDHTYTDVRGGVELTYVTGAQVITRLNLCCDGPFGWSFVILDAHVNPEADEVVVHGRMGVRDHSSGEWIYRDQFGSQKLKRSRSTGAPLDIGFDHMGATTACLKKCASLFGVGLYLMAKPVPAARSRRQSTAHEVASDQPPPAIRCQNCSNELVVFDGKPPHQQANESLKEFKRVYCPSCQQQRRDQKAAASVAAAS
jgi:Rad52/22 family double-strand break repair protein